MKFVFTSLLLFLAAATVSAQTFSGGLRAGVSSWHFYNDQMEGQALATSFTKEAFIKGAGFGKWAFEVAVSHDRYRNNHIPMPDNGLPTPDSKADRAAYQLHLKGMYELSCNKSADCPLMKRFKNYIGVVFSPTVASIETEQYMRRYDAEDGWSNSKFSKIEYWFGATHTLEYWLYAKWYISGSVTAEINPFKEDPWRRSTVPGYERYTMPNARITGTLGIGYKF